MPCLYPSPVPLSDESLFIDKLRHSRQMKTTTAWVFHRCVAAILLIAWVSLSVQIEVLAGASGLVPVGELIAALTDQGVSFWQAPTHLWWDATDGVLVAGTWLGIGLALAALLGVAPRLCFALSAPLYLSYIIACQTFLSFQWDNLLVEMTLLAALLPDRGGSHPALWIQRLLLFKVMFESGVAKWQSHLADWQDGSAMAHYYQTAPLPAPGGWFLHHLPSGWHALESWWTLFFELGVPFLLFLGPGARRLAAVIFAVFLVLNQATANYGFFVLQAAALLVVCLEDTDIQRAYGALRRRIPRLPMPPALHAPPLSGRAWWIPAGVLTLWLSLSTLSGLARFADTDLAPELTAAARPLRIANNYHLFGHITTERIEPEFQTLTDGTWTAQHLHHKPGPTDRRPSFVAPHQPRVDFRLWFYGLSHEHGTPGYVRALVTRLCEDPQAVQPLFVAPLPASPEAVRIVFWHYTYTAPGETGWWHREQVDATGSARCR
ncbi:MAG: putative membrane protein YphA (DoxX/SURF4 family) [Myxococcota bacterium]|jgi:uncharacterized membrane protein YphA (DoxX/SURF4 family)